MHTNKVLGLVTKTLRERGVLNAPYPRNSLRLMISICLCLCRFFADSSPQRLKSVDLSKATMYQGVSFRHLLLVLQLGKFSDLRTSSRWCGEVGRWENAKGGARRGAGSNTEARPSFLSSTAPSRPSREDCGGGQRRGDGGPAL